MHLVTRISLVIGLSLSLVACGGPGQPSTDTVTEKQAKTFRAALQPLCRDSQGFQRDADLEFPRAPLELAVSAQRMRKIIELESTNDAAYAKLQPPAHLAADYRTFVQNRTAMGKQRQKIAAAMEAGDRATAQAENDAFAKLDANRNAAADKLGTCTFDLSAAGRKQAIATVTEFATSKDPAKVCTQIVAAPALQLLYEGSEPAAACRAAIEKDAADGALPDSIKVFKSGGWDKLVATVDYSEKHGTEMKKIVQAKLYYIDGAWRVFSVS